MNGVSAHCRAVSVLAMLALALGAAGCESGDEAERGSQPPPTPERPAAARAAPAEAKAIRTFLGRLFMTNDVRFMCERSLTPRLFRLIYADRAACRKSAVEDAKDDDRPPERVEVSQIEPRGVRATARASLVGGDAAGTNGLLSLAKGGNGSWRLDDFSVAFLRSLTTAGLRHNEDVPRATARCIAARLARLSDPRFKRLSLGLIGDRPAASARLLETWSACERGRPGGSTLRRPLEREVTRQLRRAGQSGTVSACVIRRLRATVPDRLLIRLSTRGDRASKVRLNREVLAAGIACGIRPQAGQGGLSPA